MKRKIIGIIAGLICCAFFTGVIVFLQLPESSEEPHSDEESSQQQSSQQDFVHDSGLITSREDISSVTVTAGGKSFTVVVAENGIPKVTELNGIKQNAQLANALISLCSKIEPQKLVEETSDFGKFGLENPRGIGEITYKDSTKIRVLVGDDAVGSDELVYAAVEGQNKVWLVESSVRLYFCGKIEDYVSQSMSPLAEKTESADAKMSISGKGIQSYELERKNNKWRMTQPIIAELDEQRSSAAVNGLYGLSAEYCECIRPDDAKKAEYGLKDPGYTVSFREGDRELVLSIGNAVKRDYESEKEKYYCYLKGSADTDCIYAVAKEYLPWAGLAAQDIISEVMLPNYLVNLRSIDIEADGIKTEYIITNEGGDSSSINEDISKMRTASVKCSGKDIEIPRFREFYELLMKCPTSRIYTKAAAGSAYITIVYHKNDGTSDKLELIKTDGGFAAKVNGKISYLVPGGWAETVIYDIKALTEGKELRTDFDTQ